MNVHMGGCVQDLTEEDRLETAVQRGSGWKDASGTLTSQNRAGTKMGRLK